MYQWREHLIWNLDGSPRPQNIDSVKKAIVRPAKLQTLEYKNKCKLMDKASSDTRSVIGSTGLSLF